MTATATKTADALDDTRQAPLAALTAAPVLRRLRPKTTPGSDRVPVAAFNASL